MKKILSHALVLCLYASIFAPTAFAEGAASLVQNLAEQSGISEAQARTQVNEVFSAIQGELKAGRNVTIRKFGRFYLQEREAHTGRNPATGEAIQIPAKRYPRFRSSDSLKSALNTK